MLRKTKGLLIKNIYLQRRFIVATAVIIIILFKYLSEDFLDAGIKELQTSANIYGFIFIYILAIFTSNFIEIKTEKWNQYLNTISKGLQCEVMAKYIADFIFLICNMILVSGIITGILLYYKVTLSIKFYFGIFCAVIIVLLNSGIDNMITFVYNKIIYKTILFILMLILVAATAYFMINNRFDCYLKYISMHKFVFLSMGILESMLAYYGMCKMTMKKIEINYNNKRI